MAQRPVKPNRFGRQPRPDLLRMLAGHLATQVPDDEFDQGEWCKTARCALGHAPEVPAIRAEGLSIESAAGHSALVLRSHDMKTISDVAGRSLEAVAGHGFLLAEFLFGITQAEAEDVFDWEAGRNESRSAVAARLCRLASKYDEELE